MTGTGGGESGHFPKDSNKRGESNRLTMVRKKTGPRAFALGPVGSSRGLTLVSAAGDGGHVRARRRAVLEHGLEDRRQTEADLLTFPDGLSAVVQAAIRGRDGVLVNHLARQLASRSRLRFGGGTAAGAGAADELRIGHLAELLRHRDLPAFLHRFAALSIGRRHNGQLGTAAFGQIDLDRLL